MLAGHMINFGCPEVAPTKIHPYVALNLHPEERLETSKMNMSNESILLDSPVLPSLGMMLMKLAKVKKENNLFTLDCAQLWNIWERALTLSHLVPEQEVVVPLPALQLEELEHVGPGQLELPPPGLYPAHSNWPSCSARSVQIRRHSQH